MSVTGRDQLSTLAEPGKAQQADASKAAQNAFFANNVLTSKATAPSVEFFNASFLQPTAQLLGADGGLGYLLFAMALPTGAVTAPGYLHHPMPSLSSGATAVLTSKS